MNWLIDRYDAVVRHGRTVGPWRMGVGTLGIVMAYTVIILSLRGASAASLMLTSDLTFAISLMAFLMLGPRTNVTGWPGRSRSLPFIHFAFVVMILFFLWGVDAPGVARPQTDRDFAILFRSLMGLLFATTILLKPRVEAEPDPAPAARV